MLDSASSNLADGIEGNHDQDAQAEAQGAPAQAAGPTARRVCAECGKPITEVGVITPEEFDKQFRLPV